MPSSDMKFAPVDVPGARFATIDGIVFVHRAKLTIPDVGRVAKHRTFQIRVATRGTAPILQFAELRIGGTTCRFRTARGESFGNNQMLTLVRGPDCSPLRQHAERQRRHHLNSPRRELRPCGPGCTPI